MKFASKIPITKGWSGEEKYCVTDAAGTKYLLRETGLGQKARKEEEFRIMRRLEGMGLSMCPPIKLWWDETTVYSLHSWVEGEDLETLLPRLPEDEQYRLGLKAGRQLRIIHAVPAPVEGESWAESYARKIQRTEERYESCPLKLEEEWFFRRQVQRGLPLLPGRPTMLQHGDFHRGNLMLDQSGRVVVIDFQKFGWGDPWEEYDSITWDVQLAPAFARGRVDGYFEGQPPEVFWQLLSCYVCRGLFNGLAWAAPRGDEQIGLMKLHAAHVRDWYADGAVIPNWYRPLGLKRGATL